MFADQHFEMGEGRLDVGVIGIGVVEDDVLGLVGQEDVEHDGEDEAN